MNTLSAALPKFQRNFGVTRLAALQSSPPRTFEIREVLRDTELRGWAGPKCGGASLLAGRRTPHGFRERSPLFTTGSQIMMFVLKRVICNVTAGGKETGRDRNSCLFRLCSFRAQQVFMYALLIESFNIFAQLPTPFRYLIFNLIN